MMMGGKTNTVPSQGCSKSDKGRTIGRLLFCAKHSFWSVTGVWKGCVFVTCRCFASLKDFRNILHTQPHQAELVSNVNSLFSFPLECTSHSMVANEEMHMALVVSPYGDSKWSFTMATNKVSNEMKSGSGRYGIRSFRMHFQRWRSI